MRPHTVAEAAAVVDCVEDWQDVYLARPRPPARVRRRRVLPARRAPVPGRRRLRGLRHARGRRGHGPHPRAGAVRREGRRHRQAGRLLRLGRRVGLGRRRLRAVPRAPGPPPTSCSRCARRGRRRSGSSPAPTAPGCWSRCSRRLGRADVRVVPVDNQFFGGTTGGHRPAGGGGPRPHARRASPRATATCCPTCASPTAASSTAPAPRTCPAPSRSSPPTATPSARRWASTCDAGERPMTVPTVAIVGRPNVGKSTLVNRIVGPARRDRRGEARRHPRPQGGRRRVAGRALHAGRHRRLDAGRRLARRQGEPPERAGHPRGRRRDRGGRRRHRRHRGGQPGGGGRPQPGPRQGAPRRQQGRRRQPRGADLGGAVARPRRPAGDQRAARPRRRRRARPPRRGAARSPSSRWRTRTTRPTPRPTSERIFSVALVGRPNVGKSTLFNRLIGEDRAVVHDLPGTTRDTVDTVVETDEGPIRFVDTAGHAPQGQDRRGHRVLLAGAGPPGGRPGRRRAARHRHAPWASPPRTSGWPSASTRPAARWWCCSTSTSCSPTPRRGPTSTTRSSERLRFIGEAPGAQDLRADRQGRAQADAGPVDEHRGLPPPRAHPPGERGASAPPQQAQPGPARREGALRAPRPPPTRPPSRCSPTARCRPPYLRYLERSLREALRPRRHPDQDAGPQALLTAERLAVRASTTRSRSAKRSSSSSVVT